MLERNWRIPRVWKNDADLIENVEFEIDFTDTAFPGVTSKHAGVISLAYRQLPVDTPKETIIAGIIAFFGPGQMEDLERFHFDQLGFQYAQENATEVVLEPVDPVPLTSVDVDRERDRRISAGFTFQGVFYQTRPEDRENMAGASTAALAAIVNGAQAGDFRWHGGDKDFEWIAEDNSTHQMDAQTMLAFGEAAMLHKSSHIFAARAIKDLPEIPEDYKTNEAYWP